MFINALAERGEARRSLRSVQQRPAERLFELLNPARYGGLGEVQARRRFRQRFVVDDCGEGFEVTFKQIAGLLARRIVFVPVVGSTIARGERVGLIKFGSRVDVILPAEAELRVRPGVRVKGGASVLAAMPVAGGARA